MFVLLTQSDERRFTDIEYVGNREDLIHFLCSNRNKENVEYFCVQYWDKNKVQEVVYGCKGCGELSVTNWQDFLTKLESF